MQHCNDVPEMLSIDLIEIGLFDHTHLNDEVFASLQLSITEVQNEHSVCHHVLLLMVQAISNEQLIKFIFFQ